MLSWSAPNPASSPSKLQDQNPQTPDEGPLPKPSYLFSISICCSRISGFTLLGCLRDTKRIQWSRPAAARLGGNLPNHRALPSVSWLEGLSQTTDPSPAILLEPTCRPFWNSKTMGQRLKALESKDNQPIWPATPSNPSLTLHPNTGRWSCIPAIPCCNNNKPKHLPSGERRALPVPNAGIPLHTSTGPWSCIPPLLGHFS